MPCLWVYFLINPIRRSLRLTPSEQLTQPDCSKPSRSTHHTGHWARRSPYRLRISVSPLISTSFTAPSDPKFRLEDGELFESLRQERGLRVLGP